MTLSALALARYSQLAYQTLEVVKAALPNAAVTLLDRDESQAYVIETETETTVAFRGTEFTSVTDILRNAKMRMVQLGIAQGGKVHRGYLEATNAIADDLAQQMVDAKRPHYYVGHSAGGSVATISRTRAPFPEFTYTFGAPKVGDKEFVKSQSRHHLMRYVHARDIAPKHARPWMGYRHGGEFRKLARDGTVIERKWHWYDDIILPSTLVISTLDHRIIEYIDKLRGAELMPG